jgi:hypothetical protein
MIQAGLPIDVHELGQPKGNLDREGRLEGGQRSSHWGGMALAHFFWHMCLPDVS